MGAGFVVLADLFALSFSTGSGLGLPGFDFSGLVLESLALSGLALVGSFFAGACSADFAGVALVGTGDLEAFAGFDFAMGFDGLTGFFDFTWSRDNN